MKIGGSEETTGRKGRATPNLPVITLLTDFGTTDYFVGALKGVILGVNPKALVVDITHEIPPHDIESAAFTLLASYQAFPPGTVHVAVVDPGVGSSRRAIVVSAGKQLFVGPDNGIFSYIYDAEARCQMFQLTNDRYFRHPVSTTFHGRDVFAPVAAALSSGLKPRELGPQITDPIRLASLKLADNGVATVDARVIHIDRFGNCITNITRQYVTPEDEKTAKLRINGQTIKTFQDHFSTTGGQTLFAVWGSAGFLEIAARNRSAAAILRARRGQLVRLQRQKK